jgi:hypothetical protein
MYDNIEQINIKVDILMVLTISLMVMMLIPTQLYYNQLYKKSVVKDKKDDEDDDDDEDKDEDDEDDNDYKDDDDDKDDEDDEDDETNTENYNEKIVKNKEYDESSEITESINIGCEDLACVNTNNKCFCSRSCKNAAILNGYIIEDDINNNVSNLELKDDIHKKLFKIKIN